MKKYMNPWSGLNAIETNLNHGFFDSVRRARTSIPKSELFFFARDIDKRSVFKVGEHKTSTNAVPNRKPASSGAHL